MCEAGGKPSTVGRTGKIKGKILCLFGDQDGFIPSDQVDAVKAALKQSGTDLEVVVYPGDDHCFFCDQRESFSKEVAEDAWQRVKSLFASELR